MWFNTWFAKGAGGWRSLRIGTWDIGVRFRKHAWRGAWSRGHDTYPEEIGGEYWVLNTPLICFDISN